ncbi:SMI1/KNR4 family protein [Streptomyces xanthophaeus]
MDRTEQLLEQVADRVRNSARAQGECLPAPLEAGARTEAERILGFPLPPLLAALHRRMGDGGFGPGYGLLPLRQVALEYGRMRSSAWRWPEGVLPVADFGCGMYACVDSRSETAQVLLFDPNPGDPELAWYLDSPSLADWLRHWLDGTAWHCEGSEEGAEGGPDDLDGLDLAPWAEFRSRI